MAALDGGTHRSGAEDFTIELVVECERPRSLDLVTGNTLREGRSPRASRAASMATTTPTASAGRYRADASSAIRRSLEVNGTASIVCYRLRGAPDVSRGPSRSKVQSRRQERSDAGRNSGEK